MNIKTIAVPMFVGLSLVFGACAADQTIETPDAIDGAVQEGVNGVNSGVEDAGNAVNGGIDNLKQGAEDAGNAVNDGAKNLQKGAEDAAGHGHLQGDQGDLQRGGPQGGDQEVSE